MIAESFLGLRSQEWWEIYEAENPLAEGLRKVSKVVRSMLGGADFGSRRRDGGPSLRENS